MGTLTKCSLYSWLCVSAFSSPLVLRLPQNQNHGVGIPPVTMERVAFQQDIHHTTTEHLVATTTTTTTTGHLVATTTTTTTTEHLVATTTTTTTTEEVQVTTQDATEPEKHFAVTGVLMALIVDATVNLGNNFMEKIGTRFFYLLLQLGHNNIVLQWENFKISRQIKIDCYSKKKKKK